MKGRLVLSLLILSVLVQGWWPSTVLCLEPTGKINLELKEAGQCCASGATHLPNFHQNFQKADYCKDLPLLNTKEGPSSSPKFFFQPQVISSLWRVIFYLKSAPTGRPHPPGENLSPIGLDQLTGTILLI